MAELIYYTIYPILLWLRNKQSGWRILIAVSFIAALLVAGTDPFAKDYPSYGLYLNWLLGLPCWLIGCKLAEDIRRAGSRPVDSSIWIWRAGILLLSAACSIARFHSPIGYPWTLNFFAIAAGIWLYREILHFSRSDAPRIMEWAGTWSYSLYLIHPIGMAFFRTLPRAWPGAWAEWIFQMVFMGAFAYVFALLFEFPSHRLARLAGQQLARRRLTAGQATVPLRITKSASIPSHGRPLEVEERDVNEHVHNPAQYP